MSTPRKYDHWCVRVKNAAGAITTANIPGVTKKEFLAAVGGDEELLRSIARDAAAKCLKSKGGSTFSAQVRERVQHALHLRTRRLTARSKASEPQVWPNDFTTEGAQK